jgi:formylmethanofuran dehydrogenase subunit B
MPTEMYDMVRMAEFDNVPCPFCGLLCDDLRIAATKGSATVVANGCEKSRTLFAANAGTAASPMVDGKPADLATAIDRAANILGMAQRPLLMSAGTDVAGMRALIELAERCGGTIDHANGDALLRNLRVLQDTGWISTTLTEIRNRADLLVVAGADITRRFPRFFERCFGDFDTLFESGARELWFLGKIPDDLPIPLHGAARSLAVDPDRFAEFFSALQAMSAGRTLTAPTIAGVPIENVSELLARMRAARYGVLTWAAADLDFAHADLAIQAMCECVKALNSKNRFSVLPIGGSDGDITAQQVTTWQTGFPVRVIFNGGAPAQTPNRLDDADALLFVSSLDAGLTAPPRDIPTVVLGRAGMRNDGCSVFIPVSVPGLHHGGHLYRADNVVALHLRKLTGSDWPSAAQALQRILDALRQAQ